MPPIGYPNRINDRFVLVKMREIIDEVNRTSRQVSAHGEQLATPIPKIDQIQQALQLGGTNPLHVTGLPGNTTVVRSGPANLPTTVDGNFILGAGGQTIKDSGFSVVPIANGGTGSPVGFQYGIFAPALSFGGSSTGITYTNQLGFWELITTSLQSWVRGNFQMTLSNVGTATGTAQIGGLPFNATFSRVAIAVAGGNLSTSADAFMAWIENAVPSFIRLFALTGGGTDTEFTNAFFTNTAEIVGSFHYRVS